MDDGVGYSGKHQCCFHIFVKDIVIRVVLVNHN